MQRETYWDYVSCLCDIASDYPISLINHIASRLILGIYTNNAERKPRDQ